MRFKKYRLVFISAFLLNSTGFSQGMYTPVTDIVFSDESSTVPRELTQAVNWLKHNLNKLFFADLQYSGSRWGDNAFHSLSLITGNSKEIKFPDTTVRLMITSFGKEKMKKVGVSSSTKWPILAFKRNFNINEFGYRPEDYYRIGLNVFHLSEQELLSLYIYDLTDPDFKMAGKISKEELFIQQLNKKHKKLNLKVQKFESAPIENIIQLIAEKTTTPADELAYEAYIRSENEEKEWENLNRLFTRIRKSQSLRNTLNDLIKNETSLIIDKGITSIQFSDKTAIPIKDTLNAASPDETTAQFIVERITAEIEKGDDGQFVYRIIFKGKINAGIQFLTGGWQYKADMFGREYERKIEKEDPCSELILSLYKDRYKIEFNKGYENFYILSENKIDYTTLPY